MMRRLLAIILAISICVSVLVGATPIGWFGKYAHAELAESPWPMFCHDLQHTGRSPYTGPSSPALKWSYTTGLNVESSPAIGADGTIYVGSYDNKIYAINPDGTLKWSYTTGGASRPHRRSGLMAPSTSALLTASCTLFVRVRTNHQ